MIFETWACDVEGCDIYGTDTLYIRWIAECFSWHNGLPRSASGIPPEYCPMLPTTSGKINKVYKVRIKYQPEILELLEEK